MTTSSWRERLAQRGFPGAEYVARMHGAAVLRSMGEWAHAEAALRDLLGQYPEDVGALEALASLLGETGRPAEAEQVHRRLHDLRCRKLGVPEAARESAVSFLAAARTGEAQPARADEAFVTALFDDYAPRFDDKLRGVLAYRAPELLADVAREALGERRELEVLDLGCGTGLAGPLLRPLARRLTGVDLSAGMLERARERGVYDELLTGEITRVLGELTGAYGLIAAADVLTYFGALEPVFEGVARRLAPGGVFAFTVEKGTEPGYRLASTARYVHHADYLRECARGAGLRPAVWREGVLRTESREPVHGHVVALALEPAR